MRKPLLLALSVLICMLPGSGFAHPGKTDRYDGHKCLKDCEEWKLYYGEYHLHDKDRKPVRIAKKQKKPVDPASAPTATEMPVQTQAPVTAQTVTVYHYVTIAEESLSFNPFLWILLILLLLLLIVRLNRKKTE